MGWTRLVVYHNLFYLFFGQEPFHVTFIFIIQPWPHDDTHLLDAHVYLWVKQAQISCILTRLDDGSKRMVDGLITISLHISSPFDIGIHKFRCNLAKVDGLWLICSSLSG